MSGLIGAGIVALVGVVGTGLIAWHQRRTQRESWRMHRSDESLRAERAALLDLMQLVVATGTQAIQWVSWSARVRPAGDLRKEIAPYDQRMRELLPRLFAAEAAAASLSANSFERIDPLVWELASLDGVVGTTAAEFDLDEAEARSRIANSKTSALALTRHSVDVLCTLLQASGTGDVSVLGVGNRLPFRLARELRPCIAVISTNSVNNVTNQDCSWVTINLEQLASAMPASNEG